MKKRNKIIIDDYNPETQLINLNNFINKFNLEIIAQYAAWKPDDDGLNILREKFFNECLNIDNTLLKNRILTTADLKRIYNTCFSNVVTNNKRIKALLRLYNENNKIIEKTAPKINDTDIIADKLATETDWKNHCKNLIEHSFQSNTNNKKKENNINKEVSDKSRGITNFLKNKKIHPGMPNLAFMLEFSGMLIKKDEHDKSIHEESEKENNDPENTSKDTAITSDPVTITINEQPRRPQTPVITIIIQPTYTVPGGSICIDKPVEEGCTYSIDGKQYTESREFKDLSPGVYYISVKNSHGCVSEEVQAEIKNQPLPTYKITQPSCPVPYGTIEVTNPTGSEYSYKLDDNVQPDVIFNNVKSGKYQLCVIDKNGNTSNPVTITINKQPPIPEKPVITIIQPTYNVPAGTISIDEPAEVGCTYSIDGKQYTESREIKDLSPGVYYISVKNSHGCVSEEVQAEIKNQPPVIKITQPKFYFRFRGVIEVTQPSDPQYTYSIDDVNYQPEPKFKKVKPGKYNVTVKANGMISLATVAEIKHLKKWQVIVFMAVFIFMIIAVTLLFWALSKKNPQKLEVFKHYDFHAKIGDISDIKDIIETDSSLTFTYITEGGKPGTPHEWGYKYLDDGQENKNPACFGGIAGLYPQDNWCNQDGGRDLRKFSNKITWQAKFDSPDTNIQVLLTVFKIGGIKWHWVNKSKVECDARYQDSMDDLSLGIKELTRDYQSFTYDLSAVDKSEFKQVVGGFTTVVPLGENHVVPDSINPKILTIYIKNVYYWSK